MYSGMALLPATCCVKVIDGDRKTEVRRHCTLWRVFNKENIDALQVICSAY